MLRKFNFLIVLSLCLLSCTDEKPQQESVLNLLFKDVQKHIPIYDYTLDQLALKKDLQKQIDPSFIKHNGDCKTLVKIGFSEQDSIIMPFYGMRFPTSNHDPDTRCFFYPPLRIELKSDSLFLNKKQTSLTHLIELLNTEQSYYPALSVLDNRIDFIWDKHANLNHKKMILQSIVHFMEAYYTKISMAKFGKPIQKLNEKERSDIRTYKVDLYHSFTPLFKPTKISAVPELIEIDFQE